MADSDTLEANVVLTWNDFLELPKDKKQEILENLRQDGFAFVHNETRDTIYPQMTSQISYWKKGVSVDYDTTNPRIIFERTTAHVDRIEFGQESQIPSIYVPTIQGVRTLRDYCKPGHSKRTG